MTHLIAPDLDDLTAGWWWLQVHSPSDSLKWLCGRLFLPEIGPYFMTVEGDGYERTYGIREVDDGLNLDLDGHTAPIVAAAPVLHPEEEMRLRRQISNATRTIGANRVVMSALIVASMHDTDLTEPPR